MTKEEAARICRGRFLIRGFGTSDENRGVPRTRWGEILSGRASARHSQTATTWRAVGDKGLQDGGAGISVRAKLKSPRGASSPEKIA